MWSLWDQRYFDQINQMQTSNFLCIVITGRWLWCLFLGWLQQKPLMFLLALRETGTSEVSLFSIDKMSLNINRRCTVSFPAFSSGFRVIDRLPTRGVAAWFSRISWKKWLINWNTFVYKIIINTLNKWFPTVAHLGVVKKGRRHVLIFIDISAYSLS